MPFIRIDSPFGSPHNTSVTTPEEAMSGEKKQKPEELLAKIRKIEENKYCVNCGEYAKLGHTNVCGNPCSC